MANNMEKYDVIEGDCLEVMGGMDSEYCAIARARIEYACNKTGETK